MLIASLLIVGIFEICYLIHFGNKPEVYTDVVLEELASEFGNKSAETRLYWFGTLIGLSILSFGFYFFRRILLQQLLEVSNSSLSRDDKILIIILLATIGGNLFFYGSFNHYLIFGLTLAVACKFLLNKAFIDTVTLYLLVTYSLAGLDRLYVSCGGHTELNITVIMLLAALICVVVSLSKHNNNRVILIVQLFVPMLLLIFFLDKYSFKGEIYHLHTRKSISIAISLLLALSYLEIFYLIKKYWSDHKLIHIGVLPIAAIMAFNRFSYGGQIMINDMHHPAENTIAFNEIVNHGLEPFTEYFPVSGMYSWIQGLFLEVFGGGNYTEYIPANNVYYLAICLLTAFALCKIFSARWALIFAIFMLVTDYSRVALIVPFILLLLSPWLVSKRNLWFIGWIVMVWCYGMYYPAYGASIAVAMLPLTITQAPKLVCDWKVASKLTRSVYIVLWVALFAAIVWSLPLLLGMAKHVLAMGDGMQYLDGVTIFGQAIPPDFMNYLKANGALYTLRMLFGYIFRFTGPMLVIWLAYLAVIHIWMQRQGSKQGLVNRILTMSLAESSVLACLIFAAVCFYFSLYRMGAFSMFNRAVFIIDYALLILAIVLLIYGKGIISECLIGCAVFFSMIAPVNGIGAIDGKFYSVYYVGDDQTLVNESVQGAPRLGKGFVQKDALNEIKDAASRFASMDHDRNYYAMFSRGEHGMGFDAILDIKGAAILEPLVVRGYGVTKEITDSLLKCNAVVGNRISSADHYYLWKWLLTSGYYIWNEGDHLLYPTDGQSQQEILKANSNAVAELHTYSDKVAASLGNSLSSLQKVLTKVDVAYEQSGNGLDARYSFLTPLQGNDADYIYIELDVSKEHNAFIMGEEHAAKNSLERKLMKHDFNSGMNLIVEYQADDGNMYQFNSMLENGKLLVPIGGGMKWLCNSHAYITLRTLRDGQVVAMPNVSKLEFYSLRSIEN